MTQVKSTTLFAIEALHGVTNAACLRQRPRRPSPASGLSPDTERDHPLVKDLPTPHCRWFWYPNQTARGHGR